MGSIVTLVRLRVRVDNHRACRLPDNSPALQSRVGCILMSLASVASQGSWMLSRVSGLVIGSGKRLELLVVVPMFSLVRVFEGQEVGK